MEILHVHTKGQNLDTLEQLEVYKHTKMYRNNILNEQIQFKSHILLECIKQHTRNNDHLNNSAVTKSRVDSASSGSL